MVEQLRLHDSRVQAGTLRESDLQWTRTLSNILEKMMVRIRACKIPKQTSFSFHMNFDVTTDQL